MKNYQRTLEAHLRSYKHHRLGVSLSGEYRSKTRTVVRAHILPHNLRLLNIIEPIRGEFQRYLRQHSEVRLHKYFHHLNSSQALAFNLFLPFALQGPEAGALLARALGAPDPIGDFCFEFVPDEGEGTNVDVAWQGRDSQWTFCEVKLSEKEFGKAADDDRHRRKLAGTYAPRLAGVVSPQLLEPERFFAHYQILRNVALIAKRPLARLIILFPQENENLEVALREVVPGLASNVRERIILAHLEMVLTTLSASTPRWARLGTCVELVAEKYVVPYSSLASASSRRAAPAADAPR